MPQIQSFHLQDLHSAIRLRKHDFARLVYTHLTSRSMNEGQKEQLDQAKLQLDASEIEKVRHLLSCSFRPIKQTPEQKEKERKEFRKLHFIFGKQIRQKSLSWSIQPQEAAILTATNLEVSEYHLNNLRETSLDPHQADELSYLEFIFKLKKEKREPNSAELIQFSKYYTIKNLILTFLKNNNLQDVVTVLNTPSIMERMELELCGDFIFVFEHVHEAMKDVGNDNDAEILNNILNILKAKRQTFYDTHSGMALFTRAVLGSDTIVANYLMLKLEPREANRVFALISNSILNLAYFPNFIELHHFHPHLNHANWRKLLSMFEAQLQQTKDSKEVVFQQIHTSLLNMVNALTQIPEAFRECSVFAFTKPIFLRGNPFLQCFLFSEENLLNLPPRTVVELYSSYSEQRPLTLNAIETAFKQNTPTSFKWAVAVATFISKIDRYNKLRDKALDKYIKPRVATLHPLELAQLLRFCPRLFPEVAEYVIDKLDRNSRLPSHIKAYNQRQVFQLLKLLSQQYYFAKLHAYQIERLPQLILALAPHLLKINPIMIADFAESIEESLPGLLGLLARKLSKFHKEQVQELRKKERRNVTQSGEYLALMTLIETLASRHKVLTAMIADPVFSLHLKQPNIYRRIFALLFKRKDLLSELNEQTLKFFDHLPLPIGSSFNPKRVATFVYDNNCDSQLFQLASSILKNKVQLRSNQFKATATWIKNVIVCLDRRFLYHSDDFKQLHAGFSKDIASISAANLAFLCSFFEEYSVATCAYLKESAGKAARAAHIKAIYRKIPNNLKLMLGLFEQADFRLLARQRLTDVINLPLFAKSLLSVTDPMLLFYAEHMSFDPQQNAHPLYSDKVKAALFDKSYFPHQAKLMTMILTAHLGSQPAINWVVDFICGYEKPAALKHFQGNAALVESLRGSCSLLDEARMTKLLKIFPALIIGESKPFIPAFESATQSTSASTNSGVDVVIEKLSQLSLN